MLIAWVIQNWKVVLSGILVLTILLMGMWIQHKNSVIVDLETKLREKTIQAQKCDDSIQNQNKAITDANNKLKEKENALQNAKNKNQELERYYTKLIDDLTQSIPTGTVVIIDDQKRFDAHQEVNKRWLDLLQHYQPEQYLSH